MFDRLGGHPLRWSRGHSFSGGGIGGRQPAATRPARHGGHFFNVELKIDQSVFALCPSRAELRPSNVLVLELFQLADRHCARDRVVAWSCLPMCDGRFRAGQGKFRLPMLRGEVDRNVDRFGAVEALYAAKLENWLCNLYVEVRHLPREAIDKDKVLRNEFDVEYDFVNKLLRLGAESVATRELNKRRHSAHQRALSQMTMATKARAKLRELRRASSGQNAPSAAAAASAT